MTRPAVFYCLAAVVPAVALWLATPAERSARGMAVSPFGWPSQLVVQCLAAVPLAAVIGGWVKVRTPLPAVAAGLLFALAGFLLTGSVSEALDSLPADFATRCVVRSLLCVLLALPWAVAARAGGPRVAFALGVVAAFILPGVWAHKLAAENTAAAQDELAAQRMKRAFPLIDGVCDLDPAREIVEVQGNLKMPAVRKRLADDLKGLADDLARVRPESLEPADRLAYAQALITLDRLGEAEAVLRELVRTLPPANLPLARVLHLQGRYAESDAAVRELLAAGLPVVHTKPSIRKACLDGYDLLAENATKRGDNAGREGVLKEGLAALPAEEAYFRFQLGRHYKLTGRPAAAVRELNRAVELDRAFESQAAALVREVRELTPACVIGR